MFEFILLFHKPKEKHILFFNERKMVMHVVEWSHWKIYMHEIGVCNDLKKWRHIQSDVMAYARKGGPFPSHFFFLFIFAFSFSHYFHLRKKKSILKFDRLIVSSDWRKSFAKKRESFFLFVFAWLSNVPRDTHSFLST